MYLTIFADFWANFVRYFAKNWAKIHRFCEKIAWFYVKIWSIYDKNTENSLLFCVVLANLALLSRTVVYLQHANTDTSTHTPHGTPFRVVLIGCCAFRALCLANSLSRRNTYQPSGSTMLGTAWASAKSGAISESRKPAMPQPMRVTRNTSSGCACAKAMNSST